MDNQTYTENLNRAPEKEPERQQYFMELLRKLAEERSRELGRPLTACIQTFGCQMNAKDSEKLMGILKEAGFTESESEASDFVLYNTCTVRDNANQRVYGRLGYLNSLKQKNSISFPVTRGTAARFPSARAFFNMGRVCTS